MTLTCMKAPVEKAGKYSDVSKKKGGKTLWQFHLEEQVKLKKECVVHI